MAVSCGYRSLCSTRPLGPHQRCPARYRRVAASVDVIVPRLRRRHANLCHARLPRGNCEPASIRSVYHHLRNAPTADRRKTVSTESTTPRASAGFLVRVYHRPRTSAHCEQAEQVRRYCWLGNTPVSQPTAPKMSTTDEGCRGGGGGEYSAACTSTSRMFAQSKQREHTAQPTNNIVHNRLRALRLHCCAQAAPRRLVDSFRCCEVSVAILCKRNGPMLTINAGCCHVYHAHIAPP